MIAYASFHCWRNAQRLMDAPKIVMHEVQGYGMFKILDFLAESIGQASKPTH
jgi:hypothetical protein